VRGAVDRHMNAHNLDAALEAAYLHQLSTSSMFNAGDHSGFDRIKQNLDAAGVGADSPDRRALAAAQDRANDIWQTGAARLVRHANEIGVNLGSLLYELQAGLENPATRGDHIRDAANYFMHSQGTGADTLIHTAMRAVIEHHYRGEYAAAEGEATRALEEQQRSWAHTFNHASIADRYKMLGGSAAIAMSLLGGGRARALRSNYLLRLGVASIRTPTANWNSHSITRVSPRGHVFDSHAHEYFLVERQGWRPTENQIAEFRGAVQYVWRGNQTFRHSLGTDEVIGRMARLPNGRMFAVFEYASAENSGEFPRGTLASAFVPSRFQVRLFRNLMRGVR
jgi:hypothetical protein